MTVQVPERLENKNPRVQFGSLEVYRILTGDPFGEITEFEYPVKPEHPPNTVQTSANWRGYRATLILNEDGSLTLQDYRFIVSNSGAIDEVSHITQDVSVCLNGDFWLMCMETFYGAITYIPFRCGRVIEDTVEWKHWVPPPVETVSNEASKIRQLVDLQRRILRNTAAKRMLRSCSVTPTEFGNNQWLVYDRDVKLVYDSSTDLYAKCETEGRLRTFRTLNDLVAKLDSEIDSSKYPNVLGERKSLLALGHPGRSPRKVVMVSK